MLADEPRPIAGAGRRRVTAQPGERLGDFELISELGRGGFGAVFLARQLTLDREVALKVTLNASHEARTLASLEHEHIVPVFSEAIDPERNYRLLCMRYVAGGTLAQIIKALAAVPFSQRTGSRILDAIGSDERSPLRSCEPAEAICFLGVRIAEALSFAHSRGVLHRDVKPANVLLDRRGRPLMADFNLAFDPRDEFGTFGGTCDYMAPEHRAAFERRADAGVVDKRSDIYALGLILFEMIAGRPPPIDGRSDAPPMLPAEPMLPPVLERVIRRCLDPDPNRRYQTAAELANALDGCRDWDQSWRQLPADGPLTRAAFRWPQLMSIILPLIPHIVGAAVDLIYNQLWLAESRGTESWRKVFNWFGPIYSVIAVLLTGVAAYVMTAPLWRVWWKLRLGEPVDADQLTTTRRRALQIPRRAMILSALGWLPGVVLAPLALTLLAKPVGVGAALHMGLSFAIAGSMALAYNLYAALFLVLRVAYPELWTDAQSFWQTARLELKPIAGRLRQMQWLAGLLPLTVVLALILAQFGELNLGGVFGILLIELLTLGIFGVLSTIWLRDYIQQTIAALTGSAMHSRFHR